MTVVQNYATLSEKRRHGTGSSPKTAGSQSVNIYISDLPETTSRKYGYADDLAILLRRPSWKEMEEGLNKDMTILIDYLREWRLQLSMVKTVSAAYHLNNREAKWELDLFVDNKRMVFQQAPNYIGVLLDWMLNFKQHREEVA